MLFSDILKEYTPYKNALNELCRRGASVGISGVTEPAQGQLIYQLCNDLEKGAVIFCYSDMEAMNLYRDLNFFTDKACFFPNKEYIFCNIDTKGYENEHRRLSAVYKATSDKNSIIIASIEGALKYTADRKAFDENIIEFKTGACFDIEKLCEQLVFMGYTREEMTEGPGQFSVRGGILDIYSPQEIEPVRIEFFDDEVDSIRSFDADTQRTIRMEERCSVIPCSEVLMDKDAREMLLKHIKKLEAECEDEVQKSEFSSELEKLSQGIYFASLDKYIDIIYGRIPSLLDYIDDRLIIVVDPKRISERGKSFEWEMGERISELKLRGGLSGKKQKFIVDYNEFLLEADKKSTLLLDVLTRNEADFKPDFSSVFNTRTSVSFHGKIEYFLDDLKNWSDNKNTVIILSHTEAKAKNICGVIKDKGIGCKISSDGTFEKGTVTIVNGNLSRGFEYPDLGVVIVSDKEIFDSAGRRKRRKLENANRIKSYNDINIGDYVVHQAHGIGVYNGIKTMTVGGVSKDYLMIAYKDSDVLYVPVEQLDIIYKYSGNTEKPVKINSLGGADWSKTKTRAKKSTDDMAKQLVTLYKARENAKGFEFSEDTAWQRDFEDKFRYHETDDQLRSIEEVKSDMEKSRPMDRLLCGDVGFGKTEVALRAAFKAVMDSKQAAYLCPTTILAMQHYNTFVERMADFPVRVEMLSRFRTAAQQKKIIKKLKTGEIDVIIGTHRILGKDIEFKDLGLLIIDEEQRFGVAHKEKLKQLKNNIDVLSMTATPIPRTLHMSMISVRDMSLLTEPPENRYPVETFVMEYNPHVILGAIRNELARGGQVFYLHNRVSGIYSKAEWIKSVIPEARVSVGHGKMSESELEDIMYDMVTGNTDILVCTTIIETGLDIPNANTIIIEDADRMGLSQLYQLRGRVGRSNRAAYAYFVYKPDKMLSQTAEKRLKAIREFTQFGSGFKIAMRDLEIRGAGNLIGAEQHGHMDAVGYDMYCKLLKESVDEAQGIETEEEVPVTIDLEINAFLPERYIRSTEQRIDMYKKIAAIESDNDKQEIEDELIDRYGDMPLSVRNVVEIGAIKAIAKKIGIFEISYRNNIMGIKFTPKYFDPAYLMELDKLYPQCVKAVLSENPVIRIRIKDKSSILKSARKILELLAEKKR